MSDSLYAISEELTAVMAAFARSLDPETGEVTDPAAFDAASAQMDALSCSFADKAEAVAAYLDKVGGMAETLKRREEAITQRRKALENSAARLKAYLKAMMEKTGTKKVESPLFRITLAKSAPALEIYDEQQIPSEFWIPQPAKLDKAGIKAAIKDGVNVPGAKLGQLGTSLRIK